MGVIVHFGLEHCYSAPGDRKCIPTTISVLRGTEKFTAYMGIYWG